VSKRCDVSMQGTALVPHEATTIRGHDGTLLLHQLLADNAVNIINIRVGTRLAASEMSRVIAAAEGAVFYIRSVSTPSIAPCRRLAPCTLSFSPLNPAESNLTSIPSCQLPPRGCPAKSYERSAAATTQVSARRLSPAAAAAKHRTHPPPPYSATHRRPPPPDPMTTAAPDDPPPAWPLGPLLGNLPADLLQAEVLRRLGPTDLASLAGSGRGCAAAVAVTALMQWAKRAKRAAPGHLGFHLPPLCVMEACSHAAHGGNREVLEWLHNTGCPWDDVTCVVAARGGHLAMLQWVREHGCPWDRWTCAHAARSGHLRVLQWAWEHRCPWDWETSAFAAAGGHLTVLKWVLEQGCPCNSNACMYAAMNGQLEVLQWMRENDATGEVWDESNVRRYAAGARKQEVLTWLDERSGP